MRAKLKGPKIGIPLAGGRHEYKRESERGGNFPKGGRREGRRRHAI